MFNKWPMVYADQNSEKNHNADASMISIKTDFFWPHNRLKIDFIFFPSETAIVL